MRGDRQDGRENLSVKLIQLKMETENADERKVRDTPLLETRKQMFL